MAKGVVMSKNSRKNKNALDKSNLYIYNIKKRR